MDSLDKCQAIIRLYIFLPLFPIQIKRIFYREINIEHKILKVGYDFHSRIIEFITWFT